MPGKNGRRFFGVRVDIRAIQVLMGWMEQMVLKVFRDHREFKARPGLLEHLSI
jgi:hypothetical protein